MCPGTLKERNLQKQQTTLMVVKFWRPIFSFVFKSVLFSYQIIITSFYFRHRLKQTADQWPALCLVGFSIFTLFWTVAEYLEGNRECHQGWNSNCSPKVSFQENCFFFTVTISLAPSVSPFKISLPLAEYFLRYHWLQVWIFFTILLAPSVNILYDTIVSKCWYFFSMCTYE